MAVNKLPSEVQSMLRASANVNSFKTAVEDLVYNSIDAKSTSIAIRVNIPEGSLQVIDNGHGLTKSNLSILGQRHVTSKATNKLTLKSAPEFYGYRGEFLANLINVTQLVKITSRYENQDDTWSKSFVNGKEKKIAKMSTRPSKGTTVEVKGFLYNLHIVRKGIDATIDAQNIKSFLEELSLVHYTITVSLRDDSKNDILFKIPKKRDIYHTLTTLYNINENCVQELSVEKNQYKVKAFIGKENNEYDKQSIYINKRIIRNSKLYNIMNKHLKKYLQIKNRNPLKIRDKNNADVNNRILPFYFLFITCPYIDYDMSSTPKQSVLEFQSWEQINKLLEKLAKFYVGDTHLKLKNKPKSQLVLKKQTMVAQDQDTREKVQKIMKRILGSSSKKVEVSELQKGVKGKNIKRKNKKEIKSTEIRKLLFENKQINRVPPKCPTKETINIKDTKPTEENETSVGSEIKINDHIEPATNNPKTLKGSHKCNDFPKNTKAYKNKKSLINNHKLGLKVKTDVDLVMKNSKIAAQQARDFLGDDWKLQQRKKEYINFNNSSNKTILYQNKASIHTCKYLPGNKHINRCNSRPDFRTTYDLIKSVICSQRPDFNIEQSELSIVKYKKKDKKRFNTLKIPSVHLDLPSQKFSVEYECRQFYPRQRRISQSNFKTKKPETHLVIQNIRPINPKHDQKYLSLLSASLPQSMLANFDTKSSQDNRNSYKEEDMQYDKNDILESKLTFQSHCYNNNNSNINSYKTDDQRLRFITKQSRDNFNVANEKMRSHHTRQLKRKNYTIFNNLQNKYYNVQMQQTTDTLSYSIHCSKSDDADYNLRNEKIYTSNRIYNSSININPSGTHNWDLFDTYTINSNQNNASTHQYQITNNEVNQVFGTYNIEHPDTGPENNLESKSIQKEQLIRDHNLKIVFLSKSQSPGMEPINICRAVFSDSDNVDTEVGNPINNCIDDSLYRNMDDNFVDVHNIESMELNIPRNNSKMVMENVSHHFADAVNIAEQDSQDNVKCLDEMPTKCSSYSDHLFVSHTVQLNDIPYNELNNEADLNLKDRPRFLPKGMSQIYVNCQTKGSCNHKLDEDYYEDSIYDNFVNDVQAYSEIYEPIVQNVEDCNTKNINKFQNKLKTDNASLVFDQYSLEHAQVLNQVDSKFIAAVLTEKDESRNLAKYLVLFDQHAVSERVMLERNISDYSKENQWLSKTIENITIKLNKDEILYLHNYKDKFNQLGLQWTIVNDNEINIDAIPLAILGKHPREVDKVIKAVKLMILEEINYIRHQKGFVNLNPKSIMDLINSEACRYAIMFGDKLSKDECKDLLNSLSHCKAPFQCAHGRPVMAVLVNIQEDKHEYKTNMEHLLKFKENTVKITKMI